MLNDFTGGMPLGVLFEACVAPVRHTVEIALYYYLPRIMERADLSEHGIEVSLFQEVIVV